MEQEIRNKLTQILTDCTVNVMKLCDEYELDKDIMMHQAADMLKTLTSNRSFRYFETDK